LEAFDVLIVKRDGRVAVRACIQHAHIVVVC